jgi:hypothetical protein
MKKAHKSKAKIEVFSGIKLHKIESLKPIRDVFESN